jgi:ATP-dependent helicase HrpB
LNVVLNLATAIKEEWLRELFPGGFSESRAVVYDSSLRRVIARDQVRFHDLVLQEQLSDSPPGDEAAAILAREVAAGRCQLENWNEAVEQWILRVNRLREWMPELELPAIREMDRLSIFEHICHGALNYNEVRNRPVLPLIKRWLSRRQQAWIEEYAPERIQLPEGRTGRQRLQRAFRIYTAIKNTLWIASRRVALRIEVLAPSNRPVEVTENLSAFWSETYPKLKQELRRRYPKHEWR